MTMKKLQKVIVAYCFIYPETYHCMCMHPLKYSVNQNVLLQYFLCAVYWHLPSDAGKKAQHVSVLYVNTCYNQRSWRKNMCSRTTFTSASKSVWLQCGELAVSVRAHYIGTFVSSVVISPCSLLTFRLFGCVAVNYLISILLSFTYGVCAVCF